MPHLPFAVHVIDRFNRDAYTREVEQHFRIRHDIYVVHRQWLDLARPDGREVDPFDTDDAIYLLGLEQGRGVVAGSRLIPTEKSNLFKNLFPHLAANGVPVGHEILEWTRFFVVPDLRGVQKSSLAAGIMLCAIQEFCLTRLKTALIVVCEDFWFDRLSALGWQPRRLGAPGRDGAAVIVGLQIRIDPEALECTREYYGIAGSCLWSGRPSERI